MKEQTQETKTRRSVRSAAEPKPEFSRYICVSTIWLDTDEAQKLGLALDRHGLVSLYALIEIHPEKKGICRISEEDAEFFQKGIAARARKQLETDWGFHNYYEPLLIDGVK
jgi:hypothetical protein